MKSPQQRICFVYRKSVAILCFMLVGSSMVELASGKNILSGIRDTFKSEGSHDDAATGTVQVDKTDKQQQSSCDGQLAAALVQANDLASSTQKELDQEMTKHKAALETIVDLQQDLRDTSTKLGEEREALSQLKDEMTDALDTEEKRRKEELEALGNQATKDLEAVRGEKDGVISSLKEESAALLESVKNTAQKDLDDLKTEKDGMISSLEAQLKMSADELEATMLAELEKARLDKATKVAAITADRDNTVARLTESMDNAAKDAAEILQKTKEEAKMTLTVVEEDRDVRLAALTEEMEAAAREAAELLRTTKEEADAVLSKQIETSKLEAGDTAAKYEGKLSEKNDDIKALQENAEKMAAKLEALERYVEEANAEISHWRELHSQQTYCNMTLVTNDLLDASAVAYEHVTVAASELYTESVRIASAHISDGLEYSNRFLNEKVEDHWPSVQPYYEEHIQSNYQTHLQPHLQKHVYPRVQQASSWSTQVAKPTVLQAIDDGKRSYDAQVAPIIEQQYQTVVFLYETYCRHSLNEFLKAGQELQILKDNPPPAFLLESWTTSCEHPEDSLSALMYGSLVLLLVVFYRRILRLAWWIVSFSLSLVVRLTPLRFVVPRRVTTKSIPSPPTSPSPILTEASSDSLVQGDEADGAVEAKAF
mmetsp:Transcript_4523/g.11663  ORF Transcript_4523/g.11663 Transcript_4523/m.11663 type:complete len:656 (-) Transcript_4523:902-2869(-)